MNIWYEITVVSGFSSLIPAVAGWWRLPKISPVFYPFTIVLSANFISELISYLLICFTGNNTAWYNIYAWVCLLLISWQLFRWAPAGSYFTALLRITLIFLIVLWLWVWCFTTDPGKGFTLFLILRDGSLSSFCFYLLYRRIPDLTFGAYKDAVVLICSGWLILFVYDGITELLLFCARGQQAPALAYLEPFFSIVNFLVIFIHLIAVIWIPPKPPS